jgi:ATP-binding cassette subfamily B protein
MLLATIVAALLPLGQAWIGKRIVDTIVETINTGISMQTGFSLVLPFVLLEFSLLMIGMVLTQIRFVIEHLLNMRLAHHIHIEIMRKAQTLDLQFFEDSAFYDKIQNARNEADTRATAIVNGVFACIQHTLTLFGSVLLVLTFNPLIAVLLCGATIPSFIVQGKYSGALYQMMTRRAGKSRRMHYFGYLLTVNDSAKEVKILGIGEALIKRYNAMFWTMFREDATLLRRRGIATLGWGLISVVSFYAAYTWIIVQTLVGAISIGSMTLYVMLFRQSQSSFNSILESMNRLYESGLFIENLFSYLRMANAMPQAEDPLPLSHTGLRCIEFRGVWFRYPNHETWVLRDINLIIQSGEKLALVGVNGSGKTTLVKLLMRLYDPTEGQILIDGVDIRHYAVADLHQRIGVVFQDFVMYQVTACENIGFGSIEQIEDHSRIANAASLSGADKVIATLPEGMETLLGTWFERGQELSGGQWQKLALGRGFMRDAEVLVLDEPTAALDAAHEFDMFQRFHDLTEGRTVVLISHRFSTVRMADRIVVIENGQISEIGSHDDLMLSGRTYAYLFECQAAGYR